MNNYMYLVPVAAVIALLFAAYLAAKVSRQDAGTERMKEIAGAIADGARALLGNSSLLRSRCSVLNNRRLLRNDSCY